MDIIDLDIHLEDYNIVRRATKTRMKSESSSDSTNVRKRQKPNVKNDTEKQSGVPRKPLQLETDPSILQRRQKQIDYGKNTVGYHNYMQLVPQETRSKEHPKTPDKYAKYSRRSWDTLIKMWRKKLHEYDSQANSGPDAGDKSEDSESDDSSS